MKNLMTWLRNITRSKSNGEAITTLICGAILIGVVVGVCVYAFNGTAL